MQRKIWNWRGNCKEIQGEKWQNKGRGCGLNVLKDHVFDFFVEEEMSNVEEQPIKKKCKMPKLLGQGLEGKATVIVT